MRTAEPVHGLWCSARLKKTACGACGKPLLLFFCDCGCLVMVEENGADWRVHACKAGQNQFSAIDAFEIGNSLNRRVDAAGLKAGAIPRLRLVPDGDPLPPVKDWADGQIRPARASFMPPADRKAAP